MERADLRLGAERGALPAARAWVRDLARRSGLPVATVQVVELLTSELVGNAVVHGAGPGIVVRAGTEGEHFRVAVTDQSDALPVLRTTGPEIPGGQGMRLVDQLAESWGVDVAARGGKTVWFRVGRGSVG
jgi:anti-sigma regulatory factor (Ser/Thr protein kinase)